MPRRCSHACAPSLLLLPCSHALLLPLPYAVVLLLSYAVMLLLSYAVVLLFSYAMVLPLSYTAVLLLSYAVVLLLSYAVVLLLSCLHAPSLLLLPCCPLAFPHASMPLCCSSHACVPPCPLLYLHTTKAYQTHATCGMCLELLTMPGFLPSFPLPCRTCTPCPCSEPLFLLPAAPAHHTPAARPSSPICCTCTLMTHEAFLQPQACLHVPILPTLPHLHTMPLQHAQRPDAVGSVALREPACRRHGTGSGENDLGGQPHVWVLMNRCAGKG